MTAGWAATNTLPGKPPYRVAGIPPGIISADDYDVTEEALAYLGRAALVETALDASEYARIQMYALLNGQPVRDLDEALERQDAAFRAVREGNQ